MSFWTPLTFIVWTKKAEEKQAHKFGVNDDNFRFLGDLF